jgi:NitT/TauT family transport system substrate-binding protein
LNKYARSQQDRVRKTTVIIQFILTVAWLVFALGSICSAAEKIRVGYVAPSITQFLPWIARETGSLAKYDLNAEIILITGSPRLVQSLIAGDVDFAFAGVTAFIRGRLRGADLTILGTSTNVSSQKLVVGRASKIRRLEDLRGSTLGVSQYGSEADTFARVALAKAGIKPDKEITILQLGGHPQVAAALVAGKIEVGAIAGLAALTAEKSGAKVLTSAADLKVLSPSGTFGTTRSYIQRKRSVVERLMRSFVEAIHYLKTNPAGTISLLQKYMGGLSIEEASYLYHEQADYFDSLPLPSDKALQALLDRETDPKAKSAKPADFVDVSFLREIEKSGLVDQLYRK